MSSGTKQPKTLRHLARAGTLAGLAGASIAPAAAQSQDLQEKDEVIVEGERHGSNPFADPEAPYKIDRSSSSKLTEDLLDTAKSIAVLPKELIEDSGARTFRDVVRTQPGVTIGTGEGGNAFGDRIFIRGFDARNDVYIDGVRDPGVVSREIFAVEQIEILKGPSGAFAGRGSTGGAVSLVSKAPQFNNFGDLEASYDTENSVRLTGDINHVLTDKLAIRVNGLFHDGETAGRDEVYNDRWGAAAAILFTPTENLALSFDYYHLETQDMPDFGVPYDVDNNEPFQVDRNNFYGLVNRDFRETFANVYTGKVEYSPSEIATIKSVVRYGKTGNSYVVSAPERPDTTDPDPANWTVRANPKNRNSVNDYFANQTDATVDINTGGLEHTIVAGFEISHETIENRPFGFLDSEDPSTGLEISPSTVFQNLYNPDPFVAWPFPVEESGAYSIADIKSDALYFLDTIKFNEAFSLFGGMRYDFYRIDVESVGGRSAGEYSNNSNFLNWHLGAVYKPAENASIYASYGSSSNPSGEQVDGLGDSYGGITASTENLDPERNKSIEIGAKWNVFDEHLALTAAVYRTNKTDARVQGVDGVFTLEGEQRVQGVELGFSGQVTKQWSVHGGLSLLEAEITASPDPTQIGARLPNVAETSFNLLTRYQVSSRFHLGGQATYEGERVGGSVADRGTAIPGYWRFDAFGGYRVTDNVEVSFNLVNATDKVYYDALYRSGTPFAYVAPGRSAMFTIDVDF
ncbi:TonB-dependent siderophore receptor [Hyphococcus formosus]|uniref:TonB-dependent receptor n=1 Tax=Hyphococcus formosus TaxID=3143534 RepID=UPI00398B9062